MSSDNLSTFLNARIFDASSGSAAKLGDTDESSRSFYNSSMVSKKRSTVVTAVKKTKRVSSKCATSKFRSASSNKYTSRATKSSKNTAADEVLFAIYECPKQVESRIGICVINFETGEMILSDFMDSQIFIRTVHKIQIHQPTEILLPSSSLSPTVSKLATIIKYNVNVNVKLVEGASKTFNSTEGLLIIENYSASNKKLTVQNSEIVEKTFALNAVSAAISYTKELISKNSVTLGKKCGHLEKFRIKYQGTENTMLIDSKTIYGLELIENKFEKNGLSFLSFLDSTATKMGKRLLRNNIMQPLTDVRVIKLRLEAVRRLSTDIAMTKKLHYIMKHFSDLDKLFAALLSVNNILVPPDQLVNYVITLKDVLKRVKSIKSELILKSYENNLLKEITEILSSDILLQIEQDIDKYINDDCTLANTTLELQNQKTYAVKSGSNGLLDISRKIYKNVTDEIINEIDDISSSNDFSLEHGFDNSRGFYIKIKKSAELSTIEGLPKNLINVLNKKNHFECVTLRLIKLNKRLKEVLEEIMIISEKTVKTLLSLVVKQNSVLFMVSEALSMLDLLCCLTQNSHQNNYCYPEFSEQMFIVESRHPILDKKIQNFVPNNIKVSSSASKLQIITGCNTSGKSVYLRQVALLSIMAQIGSPIPATSATMPIFTNLHARVCTETAELTSSTFSFEMKEMAFFLSDLSPSTLMIIDELGRGSSLGDGLAISLAITEHLLEKKITTFLSTHFQDIAEIMKKRPSVTHLTMLSNMDSKKMLTMLYKASTNTCTFQHSGLTFASRFFKKAVIDRGQEISVQLKANRVTASNKTALEISEEDSKRNQIKLVHNLVDVLTEICTQSNELSAEALMEIQNQFIDKFSE